MSPHRPGGETEAQSGKEACPRPYSYGSDGLPPALSSRALHSRRGPPNPPSLFVEMGACLGALGPRTVWLPGLLSPHSASVSLPGSLPCGQPPSLVRVTSVCPLGLFPEATGGCPSAPLAVVGGQQGCDAAGTQGPSLQELLLPLAQTPRQVSTALDSLRSSARPRTSTSLWGNRLHSAKRETGQEWPPSESRTLGPTALQDQAEPRLRCARGTCPGLGLPIWEMGINPPTS